MFSEELLGKINSIIGLRNFVKETLDIQNSKLIDYDNNLNVMYPNVNDKLQHYEVKFDELSNEVLQNSKLYRVEKNNNFYNVTYHNLKDEYSYFKERYFDDSYLDLNIDTNYFEETFKDNLIQKRISERGLEILKFLKQIELSVKIRFFKDKIEQLKSNEDDKDFFPFIDVDKFNLFKKYVGQHIVDYYLDYSYLYQRLSERKFIKYIKQKDFMKWLFEKQYINEKTFDSFYTKGQFYSINKSTTSQRENNFNNIFKT